MKYDPHYYITKHKKALILLLVFSIILFIVVGAVLWSQQVIQRQGKLPVIIKTVPAQATITVGDTPGRQGTNYITPGTHTLTVSYEGFTEYKQTITISPKTLDQYIGLAPESEEAKQWQQRNRRHYAELERLSFLQAQEYGTEFKEKWPITNVLPIKDPYFSISYRLDDRHGIVLTVKGTSPRYRAFALKSLRQKGFDPTDYVVEFENFKNPLDQAKDQL